MKKLRLFPNFLTTITGIFTDIWLLPCLLGLWKSLFSTFDDFCFVLNIFSKCCGHCPWRREPCPLTICTTSSAKATACLLPRLALNKSGILLNHLAKTIGYFVMLDLSMNIDLSFVKSLAIIDQGPQKGKQGMCPVCSVLGKPKLSQRKKQHVRPQNLWVLIAMREKLWERLKEVMIPIFYEIFCKFESLHVPN